MTVNFGRLLLDLYVFNALNGEKVIVGPLIV